MPCNSCDVQRSHQLSLAMGTLLSDLRNRARTLRRSPVNYAVTVSTREIGVHPGAARGHVVRMVLGQGTRLAMGGTVTGAAGALLRTRFMRRVLYSVSPRSND